MDQLGPKERSQLMSRIRGRDTKPEMVVRRLAHGLGYRYRLHGCNLPGRPDLVFRWRRKVITGRDPEPTMNERLSTFFALLVTAWDGPMQVMDVRPAHPQSYERLFHT